MTDTVDVRSTREAPDSIQRPLRSVLATFLILVVVGGVIDLVLDRPSTFWSFHVAFEVGMVLVSLVFALVLLRGWDRTAADLGEARASLVATNLALSQQREERDRWRHRAEHALQGFSRAIDEQFEAWNLSRAEREVALLILQGAGHKQAAARLNRSERTVRQHAVEVYRKAGLQGRAELAAFFLQDLMLPNANDGESGDDS